MTSITTRCDARIAKKYRAESLIIVFRIVGQVDLGPHVERENRIRVRSDTASAVGGFRNVVTPKDAHPYRRQWINNCRLPGC